MLLTAALGVLGVASGALALAHYFAYRRGVGGYRQRVLLWIATPVSVAFWVLPSLLR
jgi:hypothetical protein